MQKKFKITFSYQNTPHDPKHPYYCSRVIDSLDYTPGNYYSKEQVEQLCNSRNWTVTIVAPNLDA